MRQQQAPFVNSSYGADNSLSSTFSREGLDLGPRPDFWSDLDEMRRRLRPIEPAPAPQQAMALRETGVSRPSGGEARYAPRTPLYGEGIEQFYTFGTGGFGAPGGSNQQRPDWQRLAIAKAMGMGRR